MLDTNICIYAMKNKPENVLQRLKKELNSGVCISSITLAELEYGMKHSSNPAKNEQALLRFLIPLSILPFGAVAATEYGAIRSGKERRKEYHGAKAVDSACRNNGGCPYCESNRLYVNRKRLIAAEERFRECEFERKIFSKEAFEVMEHTI